MAADLTWTDFDSPPQAPPLSMHPPSNPIILFPRLDLLEFLERLHLSEDLASLLQSCLHPHRNSSQRILRLHLAAHTVNLCRKYAMERPLESIAYYAANGEVPSLSPSLISQMATAAVLVCKTCKPFRPRRFEDSALLGNDLLYSLTYNLQMRRKEQFHLERKLLDLHGEASLSAVSPRVKVQTLIASHLEASRGLSPREAAAQVALIPSTYSRFRSITLALVGSRATRNSHR